MNRPRRRRRRPPIGLILFALFAGFTLLEIWLIFVLAELAGWWMTILLAIGSAILGSWMARREGLAVLARAQKQLQAGGFPGGALADGVLILLGGALLITPGLVTDLIGFSTLVAPVRRFYRKGITAWAVRHFRIAAVPGGFQSAGRGRDPFAEPGAGSFAGERVEEAEFRQAPPRRPRRDDDDVVDVEFKRVD